MKRLVISIIATLVKSYFWHSTQQPCIALASFPDCVAHRSACKQGLGHIVSFFNSLPIACCSPDSMLSDDSPSSVSTTPVLFRLLAANQCQGVSSCYVSHVSVWRCPTGSNGDRLQSLPSQLALSPPLPLTGQYITVTLNTHLSLKVEGVIEHSGKTSKQLYSILHVNAVRGRPSLVPRPSLTAFFAATTTLFAMAAKKAVREGLGSRLNAHMTIVDYLYAQWYCSVLRHT